MNEDVRFHCALPPEALLFRSLLAHEALGRLPEYRLELLRPQRQRPLQAGDLLGKSAGVALQVDGHGVRHLHGVVTEFERGGAVQRHDLYRVVLRPWLWQLTLGADSRVFQDKTVVQILESVFTAYPHGGDIEKRLTAHYTPRPYTVQYRESDFNFIARLMEDEGLHYYFRHEAGRHVLVLCDNAAAHPPIAGKTLDCWARGSGQSQREDTVLEWSRAYRLQAGRFTHGDFAAEAPGASLQASADRGPGPAGAAGRTAAEVYRYPGGQDDHAMGANLAAKQAAGQDRARREVDRIESRACVATGLTRFRGLSAGLGFGLREHEDADDYLVTSSVTEVRDHTDLSGAEAGDARPCEYGCRFEAVPRGVAFVPERTAHRPLARGPETALVVGPAGEEIHTDRYGRVRLQFHWDRLGRKDEKSSCWVRVIHPAASRQFGHISLPRVGDEVVVDFLDGNPDRPLVTGRVYNGDNLPPYPLPAQATVSGMRSRSSKGGGRANANELRFDDRQGAEYVWLQAERDFHQLARNDAFVTVGRDQRAEVGGNADQRIAGDLTADIGRHVLLKVGGDTHAGLGADLILSIGGALGLNVGQGVAVAAQAGVALTTGGGLDIDVGAAARLSAAATLHIKALGVVIDGGTQISLRAGGAFITLGPDGVSIQGSAVRINSGGAAHAASPATPARPARPKAPAEARHDQDPLAGA